MAHANQPACLGCIHEVEKHFSRNIKKVHFQCQLLAELHSCLSVLSLLIGFIFAALLDCEMGYANQLRNWQFMMCLNQDIDEVSCSNKKLVKGK
jgi:hypothetical protein